MLNIHSFFLLVFLAATQPWQAHRVKPLSTPQTIAQIEMAAQQILTQTTTPAAENALVDEKGVLCVTALEVADLKTNRPTTSQTMFRVGSTSKMFVVQGVLKLQGGGRLNLKYKLRDLAPEINYKNR